MKGYLAVHRYFLLQLSSPCASVTDARRVIIKCLLSPMKCWCRSLGTGFHRVSTASGSCLSSRTLHWLLWLALAHRAQEKWPASKMRPSRSRGSISVLLGNLYHEGTLITLSLPTYTVWKSKSARQKEERGKKWKVWGKEGRRMGGGEGKEEEEAKGKRRRGERGGEGKRRKVLLRTSPIPCKKPTWTFQSSLCWVQPSEGPQPGPWWCRTILLNSVKPWIHSWPIELSDEKYKAMVWDH